MSSSVPFRFHLRGSIVPRVNGSFDRRSMPQLTRTCSDVDEIPHPFHGIGIDGFLDHRTPSHVARYAGTARSVVDPFDVHQFLVDSERRKRITHGSDLPDVVDGVVRGNTRGYQERRR